MNFQRIVTTVVLHISGLTCPILSNGLWSFCTYDPHVDRPIKLSLKFLSKEHCKLKQLF